MPGVTVTAPPAGDAGDAGDPGDAAAPGAPDAAGDGDPLAALLAGRFVDPDDGARLGTSIRAIVIGDDLVDDAPARLDALGLPRRAVLVSDV
ncbi:MAG TPA: hypothetical protein VHE35_18000, partial [Kofleriaceae bacterium]|nr:hypothetical protein [Kofleriaceae bacterium]